MSLKEQKVQGLEKPKEILVIVVRNVAAAVAENN